MADLVPNDARAAIIDRLLPDSVLHRILVEYMGSGHYLFLALVNRRWRKTIKSSPSSYRVMQTSGQWAVQSISCLDFCLQAGATAEHESAVMGLASFLGANHQQRKRPRSYFRTFEKNLALALFQFGSLDVIRWVWGMRSGWLSKNQARRVSVCNVVAKSGRIPVLKWARAHGYGWDSTCREAARYGHLELLKWARVNGCHWDSDTCSGAAGNGHLDILKWARANGCAWDRHTCNAAARNGHLEILKWARANGCEWGRLTCSEAARGGHVDVLKWARTNGCEWDAMTCTNLARCGHLEGLKWARANDCNWDVRAFHYAALEGHVDVLEWAYLHRCPCHTKVMCNLPRNVQQWLIANRLEAVVRLS